MNMNTEVSFSLIIVFVKKTLLQQGYSTFKNKRLVAVEKVSLLRGELIKSNIFGCKSRSRNSISHSLQCPLKNTSLTPVTAAHRTAN